MANEKKFCDPPYAKFYDVSYLIFYYVKFSLYSLNRKKKDTNLDKLYTKIKLILYNEIKNINPKIKKKIFDNEYDDKLYQKMKTYFVYDLIKKKISKMKLQKGESSESEDKFELTDIDEAELKISKADKPEKLKVKKEFMIVLTDSNCLKRIEVVKFRQTDEDER